MAKWGCFAGTLRRCLQSPPGVPRPATLWRATSSAAEAASVPRHEEQLKRPEELPGTGPLESLYWLFVRGYLLHTHQLQVRTRAGRCVTGRPPRMSPGRWEGRSSGGNSLALLPTSLVSSSQKAARQSRDERTSQMIVVWKMPAGDNRPRRCCWS